MRKEHNKLIRDKIPDIIRNCGNKCQISTLNDPEYLDALLDKLVEEAKETTTTSGDRLAEELADVMEVIDSIIAFTGIEKETVIEIQKQKRLERGGFDNRIKLLWTQVNN